MQNSMQLERIDLPRDARPSWLPADAQPAQPEPCKCAPCTGFRCLCSPMFFLVLAIVGLNYAPYVLWPVIWPQNTPLAMFCICVFHVLVALLLASYCACVFTDPGTVPEYWNEMIATDEALAAEHRYCTRSRKYRPLRSHFCSVTRRVVLNMDHFCPWVINTVGFYNRKFFVLFLFYTMLACSWVVLTALPRFLELKNTGQLRKLERALGPQKCARALHTHAIARNKLHRHASLTRLFSLYSLLSRSYGVHYGRHP